MTVANNIRKTNQNGLSEAQLVFAREIFSKVKITRICQDQGVKYMTVMNVLRDQSNDLIGFKKVLDAALAEVKKQNEILATIPSSC